jgi:hypothetical protein
VANKTGIKIYGKKNIDGRAYLMAVYEFTAYSREKQSIVFIFLFLSIP